MFVCVQACASAACGRQPLCNDDADDAMMLQVVAAPHRTTERLLRVCVCVWLAYKHTRQLDANRANAHQHTAHARGVGRRRRRRPSDRRASHAVISLCGGDRVRRADRAPNRSSSRSQLVVFPRRRRSRVRLCVRARDVRHTRKTPRAPFCRRLTIASLPSLFVRVGVSLHSFPSVGAPHHIRFGAPVRWSRFPRIEVHCVCARVVGFVWHNHSNDPVCSSAVRE